MKFDLEYTFSEEVATMNPLSFLLNYLKLFHMAVSGDLKIASLRN